MDHVCFRTHINLTFYFISLIKERDYIEVGYLIQEVKESCKVANDILYPYQFIHATIFKLLFVLLLRAHHTSTLVQRRLTLPKEN